MIEIHNTPSSDVGGDQIADILTFITDPAYLGIALFPTQENILGMYYNLPFERTVFKAANKQYTELTVAAGLRGGKTTLAALIILYEFYRLIKIQAQAGLNRHYAKMGITIDGDVTILLLSPTQDTTDATIWSVVKSYISEHESVFMVASKSATGTYTPICTDRFSCRVGDVVISADEFLPAGTFGKEVPVCVIDEAGRLPASKDALKTYQAIADHVNRFGSEGSLVTIGSPLFLDDLVMTLLFRSGRMLCSEKNEPILRLLADSKQHAKKEKNRIGFNLTTFEMSTLVPHDQKFILGQKYSTPLKYHRDYLAVPLEMMPVQDKKGCACGPQQECSNC